MGDTEIVAPPGLPYIEISRWFAAPRQVLFRAHTEPALLARWLGPARLAVTVELLEPRHGGRWRWTHRGPDGAGHTFHGLYHGEPSVDRITQTYEYERQPGVVYLNTITFEPAGGGTLLRQHTAFPSVAARDGYVEDGMERGAREGMDRLDRLVTGVVTGVVTEEADRGAG
jgi:uncharacterized protein YndB with AHSA1/START domain